MRSIFCLSVLITLFALSLCSCGMDHNEENYMPLVKELHEIECSQLKRAGINTFINDTSVYSFRSKAFDQIMTKKPDAKLIAHYEELNQKLAAMEYLMDPDEKKLYQDNFKGVYLKQCE